MSISMISPTIGLFLYSAASSRSDLLVRLVQILRLDNRLADKHVNGLLVAVRLNVNIVGHAVVIALVGGDQRLTYTVEHIVYRNAFFLFQLFQRVKNSALTIFSYSAPLYISTASRTAAMSLGSYTVCSPFTSSVTAPLS